MYKLINPDGFVHDFAHKMWMGHAIEGSYNGKVIEFDGGMNTDQFYWDVFHYLPIHRGDFIILNMNSGKIGLYECVNVRIPDINVRNRDLYKITANWCGYFDKETGQRTIFNGYGIEKPLIKISINTKAKLSGISSAIFVFFLFVLVFGLPIVLNALNK